MKKHEGDIMSIIPASDWCVWRHDDDGVWRSTRLAAWGLTRSGDTVALEPDSHGSIETFPWGKDDDDSILRHVSEGPPPGISPSLTAARRDAEVSALRLSELRGLYDEALKQLQAAKDETANRAYMNQCHGTK